MNPETLTALQGSIAKWERVVAGKHHGAGAADCPLCKLFNPVYVAQDNCAGCPVYEKTGNSYCYGTPFEDYEDARDSDDSEREVAAAKQELDFLKSLLPEANP